MSKANYITAGDAIDNWNDDVLDYIQRISPPGAQADHPQPLETIDETDKNRTGFIRSHCRHCGKFLGYRRGK